MEGRKFDSGKPRLSLVPVGTMLEVAAVLTLGARKYDDHNWQKVPDARTRYYDALWRHVEAWRGGEMLDPESGHHHLAHATCCCLFLLWFGLQDAKEVRHGTVQAGGEAPYSE